MESCIWLNILGLCSEFYNNEFTIFNIWAFMTLIWVFFAWFQLINSIHKIRFRVRYNKFIVFLVLVPLLSSVIGTLIPLIPWKPLPLLWYPIFWEIFTALYIIIIWLILTPYLFFNKINKFDIKTWKINIIYIHYLAKNKDIQNIVDELQYFFDDFLRKYKKEIEEKKWWYAHQFITIIQNQRFIDYLIENPFTIQKIIFIYKKEKRTQFSYEEQEFLKKVILWSFKNNNSFLVHELNWNFNIDFGNQNWIILKNLIEDLNFLSKLNILWDSETFWYSSDIIFAKNYLKFILKIHEEFLNKNKIEQNYLKYELLLKVFETQEWIIQNSYKKIDWLLKSNIIISNFKNKIWKLEDSLLNLYPWNKFPEIILNKEKPYWSEYHELESNISILDAYAFWIYKLLCAFTYYKNADIRHYTLEFSSGVSENFVFKQVEKRLFILYKQKINDNLLWYYPMISRVFWENYIRNIINETDKVNKNKDIINIIKIYAEKLPKLSEWYIYRYTNDTLKNEDTKEIAIKKANNIIKDLFTKNIEYDKEKNILIIFWWDNLYYSKLDLSKILKNWKIEIMNK